MAVQDYNYNSVTAFHYFALQIRVSKLLVNYIIDRSPILNIAFQYMYWLMDNMTETLSLHKWCENYRKLRNMTSLLEHIKSLNLNIVIIVNTIMIMLL